MKSDTLKDQGQIRLIWLDILKGICMFFIVMSHSRPPLIYTWFYTPFFLAGFFFASGYTFSPKSNASTFLLHKLKTILLPYWAFGLINTALAHVADGDNIANRVKGLLLSINGKNDDLWFVMCLLSMQIIFYLLWRFVLESGEQNAFRWGGALSFILCAGGAVLVTFNVKLPFQFETALIMIPFMFMGYMWKKEVILLQSKNKSIVFAVCLIIYILFCMAAKNTVNIHGEQYSIFIVFIVQALLGVIVFVMCSQLIENKFGHAWIIRFLVFIGQNTFVYYAFQSKAIRLLDILWDRLHFGISDYIRNPIYAIICCIVLAIPAAIINRFFPFLLGRNFNHK